MPAVRGARPFATGRRLPYLVDPRTDEPFSSWLARLAAGYRAPLPLLLATLGLIRTPRERKYAGYDIRFTAAERRRVTAITGLGGRRLDAMTLSRYNGSAIDLTAFRPAGGLPNAHLAVREWCYFGDSHFCPDCLDEREGAWLLGWRLPWSFACTRHAQLLLAACPTCGVRPGLTRRRRQRGLASFPLTVIPEPGRCGATGARGDPVRCQTRLADAAALPLGPNGRLLRHQQRLDRAIDAGGPGTRLMLGELRSLCALLLLAATPAQLGELPPTVAATFEDFQHERHHWARHGPQRRVWSPAPRDPQLMAAVIPTASELLDADQGHAAEQIAPLVRRLRDEHNPYAYTAPRFFRFTPRLSAIYEAALNREGQRLYRLGVFRRSATPRQQRTPPLDPDYVPQLIWPEIYESRFRPLLGNADPDFGRRFVSIALVKLSTGRGWDAASRALGCPLRHPKQGAMRALRQVTANGNEARLFDQITTLAAELHDAPTVNYGERRRALANFTDITDEQWKAICASAPLDRRDGPGGPRSQHLTETAQRRSRRLLAAWIWADHTSGWWRWAPALHPPSARQATGYASFLAHTVGPNVTILRRVAAEHIISPAAHVRVRRPDATPGTDGAPSRREAPSPKAAA
jgi:hypothetical protein